MKMTRQHFQMIADVLIGNRPNGEAVNEYRLWRRMVKDFASALAATNGGFKRERFEHAAGLE